MSFEKNGEPLMLKFSRRDVFVGAGLASALGINCRLTVVSPAQARRPMRERVFYTYKVGSVEVTTLYDGIWKKPPRIIASKMMVCRAHFTFLGTGSVAKDGSGYAFTPVTA
jgi:hypothetical protein